MAFGALKIVYATFGLKHDTSGVLGKLESEAVQLIDIGIMLSKSNNGS